ncbi:Zn2Cys6 transcriptional regulator [Trichoderma guizhouense]|uniref:Zn2Cys6 transcriptional regulator n=1 Tax=Trichoderma guizhouense TaxID=1491466 RepID=A0A1T3CSY4_9HYPO|nr:Zn2Cys6 transcriptional regulator [Trichoderma guizhouense]
MASNDPSIRRILPQDSQNAQSVGMNSYTFAPQQYPQRETQKNYVFVDEHNRHKRLKVMRACEGCRRRKIKCDAATTNTWPCSACIRLKLHCVRPNGYDGATDSTTYEAFVPPTNQFQQMGMPSHQQGQASLKSEQDVYAPQAGYPDAASASFQTLPYDASQPQHNLHYTTVPPQMSMVDQHVAPQDAFPTPPMQQSSQPGSSPGAYSADSYQQQDLADLLGGLKMNEIGTAPYLRNKASFRREEPAVEDDDDLDLPPISIGPGHRIRIPPELMPDDGTAIHYFDLYFTHVHPYVPVLNRSMFYRQWATARESISPLILEALFAIGGRLADEPAQGQQWLALASRHADAFMDVPRLSTLQALLMILKAREAAPKRGYYYRSWMTVVQCVQMAKDLGLEEHYEEHQAGRPCEYSPTDCQLRTRIWQTVFVCEVMVGTPQGRYNLAVDIDSVDFNVPKPIPGGDDAEYHVSRNFTYFARNVRNIARITSIYVRLRKRKDWGVDPEFQQMDQHFNAFLAELPADLSVTFPPDGSAPWLPSPFLGNLHSYYYLTLILFHRPQLSFLDPTTQEAQWKHHMMICYNSARALCRLQEAVVNSFGTMGLQCMQRGFSFTVYAGLSCIVLHLVAIVSPDPDLHTDAREFFTRHMRIMEKVMEAWPMPELQRQIDAVREAFSADVRKPFVLKPSFPYGSPHPSHSASPPGYRGMQRAGSMEQALDSSGNQTSLVMMPQAVGPGIPPNMALPEQPAWNPARIFEQWNTTFGTPAHTEPNPVSPASSLNVASSSGAPEVPTLEDIQAVNSSLPSGSQHSISPHQYVAAPVPNFVTPAMWQESVASVYEGGLKRGWDYDGTQPAMKRR